VFRVAVNTARDLRSTAWRKRRVPLPGDESVIASDARGPDAELLDRERLDRLRCAVTELRPQEQEVFLLRQNGAMTYEQIAQAIDVPLGTVKTRMRLALARLRAALEAEA
jgi:RNA polymerase sigma-70 factor (ECF subfamily)